MHRDIAVTLHKHQYRSAKRKQNQYKNTKDLAVNTL